MGYVMSQYWFKPKTYGYGATPTTWQGWVLIIATVFAMVAVSLYLGLAAKSYWALAALAAFDIITLAFLTVISRRKTNGEWRWRWGKN